MSLSSPINSPEGTLELEKEMLHGGADIPKVTAAHVGSTVEQIFLRVPAAHG